MHPLRRLLARVAALARRGFLQLTDRIRGAIPGATAIYKVWLVEIWGEEWDRQRRRMLLNHYLGYMRDPPIPTDYLPDPEHRMASEAEQRAVVAAFTRRIEAVQAGAPESRGVFLSYRPIGRNLRMVSTDLRRHAEAGRRLVIKPGGPRYERQRLEGWGFDWDPWLWARSGTADDQLLGEAGQAWSTLFRHPAWSPSTGQARTTLPSVPWLTSSAGPFSPRHLERVLKMAAASSYVFSPAAAITEQIEELKAAVDWPPPERPVLGIHVRRGDAAKAPAEGEVEKSTRRSFPLARYLETADTICERYGIRDIFLATESEEEIERASRMRPGYRFIWLDYDRSMFPDISNTWHYIEDVPLFHPELARPLAISGILDLALFRDCHAFIGAFNSEFSVLAWLLMIGSRGALMPYVSLSQRRRQRWSLNPHVALRYGSDGALSGHAPW